MDQTRHQGSHEVYNGSLHLILMCVFLSSDCCCLLRPEAYEGPGDGLYSLANRLNSATGWIDNRVLGLLRVIMADHMRGANAMDTDVRSWDRQKSGEDGYHGPDHLIIWPIVGAEA